MWGIFIPSFSETINFLPPLLSCLGFQHLVPHPTLGIGRILQPLSLHSTAGGSCHSQSLPPHLSLIITRKPNLLGTGKVLFFCLEIVSTYNLWCNIKPLSSHSSPTGHLSSAAKSCPGRATEVLADRNPRPGTGRIPRVLIRHSRRKTEPQGFSGATEALQLDERASTRLGAES